MSGRGDSESQSFVDPRSHLGYQIGRVLQWVMAIALIVGMVTIPGWPTRLIFLAVGGAIVWRVVTQTGTMVRGMKIGDQTV